MNVQKIPRRYIPSILSKRDSQKQRRAILKSRKAYRRGQYINRPTLKSFKTKKSSHVYRATHLYGVESMQPNQELVKATGCNKEALEQIIRKGEGAFYSSGSRPNQTPQSWGYARLGSALTGGPSSQIDYSILEKGCSKKSRPLYLANQTRKNNRK